MGSAQDPVSSGVATARPGQCQAGNGVGGRGKNIGLEEEQYGKDSEGGDGVSMR